MKIKIKFVDFFKGFDPKDNDFIHLIRKHYEVELCNDPDFLFYSCFGYEHLKYNCVRIFYTGECVCPDFNICDYAIGFEIMSYGDRYLRFPLYALSGYRKQYLNSLNSDRTDRLKQIDKLKFCAFVVSNSRGQEARKQIFDMLSQYKRVDSGGMYLNNIGYCVKDKQKFLRDYKFSIAFENCVASGYTTEKIIQAFEAGTIPIYYGNPKISEEFNEKAFVNCHNYNTFSEVADEVRRIDGDLEAYKKMLQEPIQVCAPHFGLEEFLLNIVSQDRISARRRPFNPNLRAKELYYIRIARWEEHVGRHVERLKNAMRKIRNKIQMEFVTIKLKIEWKQ